MAKTNTTTDLDGNLTDNRAHTVLLLQYYFSIINTLGDIGSKG
jgi:hypothetical protein